VQSLLVKNDHRIQRRWPSVSEYDKRLVARKITWLELPLPETRLEG
jgi:hypothetical protein